MNFISADYAETTQTQPIKTMRSSSSLLNTLRFCGFG